MAGLSPASSIQSLPWLVLALQHLGWAVNPKLPSDCSCVRPRRATASPSRLLMSWTLGSQRALCVLNSRRANSRCVLGPIGARGWGTLLPPSPVAKLPQSWHLPRTPGILSCPVLPFTSPPPGGWGNQGGQSYSFLSSQEAAPSVLFLFCCMSFFFIHVIFFFC